MNHYAKRLITTLLALFIVSGTPDFALACDRSEIVLDSLVQENDGTVSIYITQSIGGGVTGVIKGADANTSTFAYAFYGPASLSTNSYTLSLTADRTGTTNTGADVGSPFGSQSTIAYFSPGPPYTCINSSAQCGLAHTDVQKLTFNLTEMPDSVRLLGVEGGGNPTLGCVVDTDMMINFTTLPVVWNSFSAQPMEQEIALEWSTSQEVNTSHYTILRSADGKDFSEIGTVNAEGNSSYLVNYEFMDYSPMEGTAFYQIVQYDLDGKFSKTEVVAISFSAEVAFAWVNTGANPVSGYTQMEFSTPNASTAHFQVFDLSGKQVFQQKMTTRIGNNTQNIDFTSFKGGLYIVRISQQNHRLEKKILKL